MAKMEEKVHFHLVGEGIDILQWQCKFVLTWANLRDIIRLWPYTKTGISKER